MTELKKSFSNLISTKIFLVAFTFASFNSLANTLDKDEDLGYARACFNIVDKFTGCYQGRVLDKKYSYLPSKILRINNSGARIESKIKVKYQCEFEENKGWGEKYIRDHDNEYLCVSDNVMKSDFPKPNIFISLQTRTIFYREISIPLVTHIGGMKLSQEPSDSYLPLYKLKDIPRAKELLKKRNIDGYYKTTHSSLYLAEEYSDKYLK